MKEQEPVCPKPACFAACLQLKLISRLLCWYSFIIYDIVLMRRARADYESHKPTVGQHQDHPDTHVSHEYTVWHWEITEDLNRIITRWIKHVTGSMWSICNTFIRYTTTLQHKALRFTRPLREQTRSAWRLLGTVQNVPFTLLSEPVQSRRSPQPAPLEALNRALCELNLRPNDVAVVSPSAALIIPTNIVNILLNDTACTVFVFECSWQR